MNHVRGVFGALLTPFTEDGEHVDEVALRQHIEYLIANNVHGLVTAGSTGECATLTFEERREVLEITLDQVQGRLPVFAHTAACATRDVVSLSRHAQRAGAAGLMVVGPYYGAVNENELYKHFATIASSVDLPLMIYNYPAVTGYSLRPELIADLARTIDNITMVKDNTGDISRIHFLLQECGDDVSVFNGADTLAFASFVAGTVGTVWGAVNATPKLCTELFEVLVNQHDIVRGREIWRTLYPLNRFFVQEGYVAAVKAATYLQGFTVGEPRPPLLPLPVHKVAELRSLLTAAGLYNQAVFAGNEEGYEVR